MTKKILKNLTTLLMAIMMVTTMLTPAFAEGEVDDTIGADGTLMTTSNILKIPKSIVVKNATKNTTVYGPKVGFSFSIEPCTVSQSTLSTVSGTDVNTINLYSGIAEGVVLNTPLVEFNGAETVTTISEISLGDDKSIYVGNATKYIQVTVNLAAFAKEKVGAYRYVLTDETADAILAGAGLTRVGLNDKHTTGYNKVRYLDVYIGYGTADDSKAMLGYALVDLMDENTDERTVNLTEHKSPGFTVDVTNSNTSVNDLFRADNYLTYNIDLKKQVTGFKGEKTCSFPFSIDINNNGSGMTVRKSGEPSPLPGDLNATSGVTTFSASLANNELISIEGLSPKAQVKYTEENNTESTYKVAVEDVDHKGLNPKIYFEEVQCNSTGKVSYPKQDGDGPTLFNVSDYSNPSEEGKLIEDIDHIIFVNNLNNISPTGLLLRFAPFLIIFAFGVTVAILILYRTARSSKNLN